MLDSCENVRTELHSAAVLYRNFGWSVLPIRGDSDSQQPKAAAVNWSQYQKRLPTDAELDAWFFQQNYQGLGVICGPISGLVVLDFDDSACAAAFAAAYPDLIETFTVRSGKRNLPHYYYRVPGNMQVRTQRTAHADFQAQGTYVVAAPTQIDGQRWQIVYERQPRWLNPQDVNRIRTFLEAYAYQQAEAQDQGIPRNLEIPNFDLAQLEPSDSISALRLGRIYRRWAVQMGRNHALFRAACLARDSGWSRRMVADHLLDLHVVQPPVNARVIETPEQRRREGLRTIFSAFRHPRRPRVTNVAVTGLPNSIREALLQARQTAVARVLDGLLLAGLRAGAAFTERMACELLRVFQIGRRAVQAALKALTPGQERVFETVNYPPDPPEDRADAAQKAEDEVTKCLFVRGAKRVRIGHSGRTPTWYILPDHPRLYRILKARPSGSDRLTADDLRSPEAYRCALQRALIARRPGRYSRRWLAQRLGISIWTCRRYDRRSGLVVQPMYTERQVFWMNLDHLPLADAQPTADGSFLETGDGRRFPPVRGLAAHLLARQQPVIWKRQGWNYYGIEQKYYEIALELKLESQPNERIISDEIHKRAETYPVPVSCPVETVPPPISLDSAPPGPVFWLCPECKSFHIQPERPGTCTTCQHDQWQVIPEAIWRDPERCKVWWRSLQPHRHQTLVPERRTAELNPSQQNVAQRLYQRVRQLTPARSLTLRMACQLVKECGPEAVERVLGLLDERRSIANAAGFVITVLRGEGNPRSGRGNPSPAQPLEATHAAWIERLKQSPYALFYANAEHILAAEGLAGK